MCGGYWLAGSGLAFKDSTDMFDNSTDMQGLGPITRRAPILQLQAPSYEGNLLHQLSNSARAN